MLKQSIVLFNIRLGKNKHTNEFISIHWYEYIIIAMIACMPSINHIKSTVEASG